MSLDATADLIFGTLCEERQEKVILKRFDPMTGEPKNIEETREYYAVPGDDKELDEDDLIFVLSPFVGRTAILGSVAAANQQIGPVDADKLEEAKNAAQAKFDKYGLSVRLDAFVGLDCG